MRAFSTCTSALVGEREGLWRLQRSEQNLGVVLGLGLGFFDADDVVVFRLEDMTRPQVWQ
jgi:hypothetical protein